MTQEKPIYTKVVINDVTVRDDSDTGVTDYISSWSVTRKFLQGVSTVNLVASKAIENVLTIDDTNTITKEITIQRGATTSTDEYVFRGEILGITEDGGAYIISGKDNFYKAIRAQKTKTFDINVDTEAGVGSEIFKTLVNGVTGLVATDVSVQSTGSVNVLKKFVCNHAEVYERCDNLAKIYDWQMFYNPNTDLCYFENKGYVSSTITLEVGVNIVKPPKWKFNATKLINKIYIIGSEQEVEKTYYYNGDGTTTNFSTVKTPKSVKIWSGSGSYSPSGGTFPHDDDDYLVTGGKEGSTSGSYDYTYDIDQKTINFESTSIPTAGTNNVEVNVSYMLPSPVVMQDPVSQVLYGIHEKTLFKDEFKTISDAELFASNEIQKFKDPFVFAEVRVTNTTGLNPGELVKVIDSHNNIDRWLLITQMVLSYPYRYDTLTVGDEVYKTNEWEKDTSIRIRRLEEKAGESTDLLLHIISLDRNTIYERRDFQLSKTKIMDSFILGHPINGLLGMGKILDKFNVDCGTNWTGTTGVTITDDTSTTIVGTGSAKIVWTPTSGTIGVSSTQSFGDLSSYTGVNSGTPSQGTIGMWWNSANTTDITDTKLRIGSGASDYIECSAREYASVDGYINWNNLSFDLRTGWNYYVFDIDNPDSVVGTPDWTSCDYSNFIITINGASTAYMDYYTISSGSYIGLNGLGDRKQSIGVSRITPGQMIYKEYLYDDRYIDTDNTDASSNTTDNYVEF